MSSAYNEALVQKDPITIRLFLVLIAAVFTEVFWSTCKPWGRMPEHYLKNAMVFNL